MLKRLDVGCGEIPTGDVNVDFSRHVQAKGRTTSHTQADVICSAEWLPFRSKSFEEVYSSHMIEHLENPSRFIIEAERIAARKVHVVCPSRWMKGHRRNPFHRWTLTRTWFVKKGYACSVDFWTFLVIPPFRILLPNEITAVKIMDC